MVSLRLSNFDWKNEINLWIAAAYGDNDAVNKSDDALIGYHNDISAAMIAQANGYIKTARLLAKKYPNAPTKTEFSCHWYFATHKQYKYTGKVVLPVSGFMH
jgi:hypothetical protein